MGGFHDIRDVAASPTATFLDVIRFWAERTPDAPALLTEPGGALSYRDLAGVIEATGAALHARGFGRGDRIGIVHPGGADMAAALMGIWSHATVIPLSPRHRLGEYSLYLRDLRVDAVAIAAGLDTPARTAAERLGLPVLDLVRPDAAETGRFRLDGAAVDRPYDPAPPRYDDIAAVLMTSGTTVESKLVPRRQKQLVARAEDCSRLLEYSPAERGANMMQLYHGAGLGAITYTLFAGGSLANFAEPDLPRIFRALEALRPTYISGPYTIFHAILAQQERLEDSIRKVRPGLRLLRAGSGHLDPRVATALEAIFGIPVIQAYSSTETSFMACEPLPPRPRKAGSVGKPGNTKVLIVDEQGNGLPANTTGEIIVKSPGMFDGYENNPQANAESFIDGWFRTGDMGYFDADGYLFLTGRIKEVINRGGQKFMPGEIEAAIMAHPGVLTAAAFPVPHPTLGEDVAAAVVREPGAALDRKTLTRFLRDRLGAAKLPRQILFVDDIPKGKTGKVQRNRLAAAFGLDRRETLSASDGYAAASTATEGELQRIWAETLKLPSVPVDADFFSLGGDSLLAVELFLRIEEELGRRLPRAALFEASTVAEMARHIDAAPAPRCLVPIQTGGDRPPLFCVHDRNGHVLNFRALARHLGPDQPVYGLQLAGLDGTEPPLARIEDMAARYLAEIRTVQPAGPYRIGGYSMGGLIAYEMARRLREQGEDVALLALFDTFPRYGPRRSILADWFTQRDNVLRDRRLPAFARFLGRGADNIARNTGTMIWRRLFGLAWWLSARCLSSVPRPLRRPVAANLLASRTYRIRPYGGDAALFTAGAYRNDHDHMVENWRTLIGGRLAVLPVPGLHNNILEEPHVQDLARVLSGVLRNGAARHTPSSHPAAAGLDETAPAHTPSG